ncbi:unnamed protein product [Symbiodinium sp. CCMP2456]|nr:unnamed protein product [Symbiodinium sp. CCMP2456]
MSIELKLQSLAGYRDHLASQFKDRMANWTLQELSRDHLADILCIQLDGMDQGKYALPRDPELRTSAAMSSVYRPRIKLHGVWCFGYTLQLFLLDEPTKHDSNCIQECLARTLERVSQLCEEKGEQMPRNLSVWGDNTVRELKNQHLLKYFSFLVAKTKFRSTAMCNLRKSHSHDRIDQLWGIFARRVQLCQHLQTPEDILECLLDEVRKPSLQEWIGSEVQICRLNAVRSWSEHWAPAGMQYAGGLKEDAHANHCFLLSQRRGQG